MTRGAALGWALSAVALLGAPSAPASAQLGSRETLPVEVPERPFLLVDAPRRFLPGEPASLRVQLRDGGRVEVALFRVRDPDALLGQAGARQGVSVAPTPIGREAESLLLPGAPPRARSVASWRQSGKTCEDRGHGRHPAHDRR